MCSIIVVRRLGQQILIRATSERSILPMRHALRQQILSRLWASNKKTDGITYLGD
jgi:hypothetical protein